jgi:hypothetical protein
MNVARMGDLRKTQNIFSEKKIENVYLETWKQIEG